MENVNTENTSVKKAPDDGLITPDFEGAAKILRKYKNRYEGQRCFIIGNGPSLKAEDLDKIKDEFSIASNRIFLIFKDTAWRPTFFTAKDGEGIRASMKEMSAIEAELKIIPVYTWGKMYPVDGALPVRIGKVNNLWYMTRALPEFSEDITRCVHTTVTITYTNLQIAMYLGFKDIILLGIDHCYSTMWHIPAEFKHYDIKANKHNFQNGQIVNIQPEIQRIEGVKDHFCDNYLEGITVAQTDKFEGAYSIEEATLSYQSAKKYAEEHGIRIRNATRGGKLNVFKRVNFDSLFPKKQS